MKSLIFEDNSPHSVYISDAGKIEVERFLDRNPELRKIDKQIIEFIKPFCQ